MVKVTADLRKCCENVEAICGVEILVEFVDVSQNISNGSLRNNSSSIQH